jgi:glutaminyl-peptide cyclotransferase
METAVARKPQNSLTPPRSQTAPSRETTRRRWRRNILLAAVGLVLGSSVGWFTLVFLGQNQAATWHYRVVHEYPHDPGAYTQGLVFHDGLLYEGTGKYGESTLRKVELESGRVLQHVPLSPRHFGEGITIWNDEILQLTWRERAGLIYDLETLRPTGRTFRYAGEGWGLTHDGQHLILSDGTSVLRFLDPETFEVVRRLAVRSGRQRIIHLNELEYIDGEIFANIWKKDYLARISPRTGEVLGWVDLRGLWPRGVPRDVDQVLNGIAYDAPSGRLFVTGKNWPRLYEIELVKGVR